MEIQPTEQLPGMAPAPESPSAVPGIPNTIGEGEMPQDEMKNNLQELMAKIEGKYQEFNAQGFASDAKVKQQESETLREIFDFLQSMGIDPSDVEAVRAFLDKIKSVNPELSQQIETTLSKLLGEDISDEGAGAEEPAPENMNISNEDIQQNI